MQRLLINIGNTHIQVARLTGAGPELLASYDTAAVSPLDKLPILDDLSDGWNAWAISVVPPIRLALERKHGSRLRFLTVKDFPQIDFALVDTSTLGLDRIANAAAARAMGSDAVMVIDCGTAITTEAVDEMGRFRGGAILPGRLLQRRSLSTYTAQLPLISLQSTLPTALGSRTVEAITAGIDLGIIGAVRELIAASQRQLSVSSCLLLATGGDAPFFLQHLPGLTAAPPLFTLRGIAEARPNTES